MSNSEDEALADLRCRNRNFRIRSSSSQFSYQMRSESSSLNYAMNPKTEGTSTEHPCILGSQSFDQKLSEWLSRNIVFSRDLYFVPKKFTGRVPESIVNSFVHVHPKLPRPNMQPVNRLYHSQVAQLDPFALKVLAGIFKAIKVLHARRDYHHGDLSIPDSYGLKIINTSIGGSLKKEVEVVLIPGIYLSEYYREVRQSESSLIKQQRLDISQIRDFIFHVFLVLPDRAYFANDQKNLGEPRVHCGFENLRHALDKFSSAEGNMERDDKELHDRLSTKVYNHYATLDFGARMRQLSHLIDNPDIPRWQHISHHMINWKDDLQGCPEFCAFYFRDTAHYGSMRRDLLRFIGHLFSHAKQRFPNHGLCDPEYLDLVLAHVFHKWYECFFD